VVQIELANGKKTSAAHVAGAENDVMRQLVLDAEVEVYFSWVRCVCSIVFSVVPRLFAQPPGELISGTTPLERD